MRSKIFCCAIGLAALPGLVLLSGCAVVDTGATVVKAGASVVGTSVSVATGVVATTVDVTAKTVTTGVAVTSAGVAAGSAAKTVTIAAASTAIAAGSLVAAAVTASTAKRRADDVATLPVVATAADLFVAHDGRQWTTRNCADSLPGQPALWVALRTGEAEIRTGAGLVCPVLVAH